MPVAAGIGAAGAIGSSLIGASAASKASKQQANAIQSGIAAMNALFSQAKGEVQPFIDLGTGAGKTLSGLLTPGPGQTDILSNIPGFKFAQDWGQKAVQNIGSTIGFGGNTLKAGADYATGVAQQGFGTIAQLLQNLTNTGAGAANSLLTSAVGQGANISGAFTGLGNAQASGTLGVANALSGGLTGSTNAITNALILPQVLSALKPNTGTSPASAPGIYSGSTSPFGGYASAYG